MKIDKQIRNESRNNCWLKRDAVPVKSVVAGTRRRADGPLRPAVQRVPGTPLRMPTTTQQASARAGESVPAQADPRQLCGQESQQPPNVSRQFVADPPQFERTLAAGLTAALAQQGLLHGALHRAGIWRQHQDYNDYLQEAFLAYAEAYQNYPGAPDSEPAFLPFAFQQVCWRVTDLLRYQQRRATEELPAQLTVPLADFGDHSVLLLVLERLTRHSSALDQLIIREHFIAGLPLSKLAQKYQLSPRSLRMRRQYLRRRLGDMLNIHPAHKHDII